MKTNLITNSIRKEREYGEILKTVSDQLRSKKALPLLLTGLSDGARFTFYAALAEDIKKRYGRGYLLIVPDEKEALRLSNAFADCDMLPLIYPLRDFVYHNITSSHEYEHERLAVLSAVINDKYDVIITTPDAALQYTVPRTTLISAGRHIKNGDTYDIAELTEFLHYSGYARVDMVDGTGQYSVRGGIFDIFPPQNEYPVRIDFFGDEVEQIGIFDIMTQRRIENITGVAVTPAREILVSDDKRDELKDIIKAQMKRVKDDATREILAGELEACGAGTELNFADKYISVIYEERFCLLDYFTDNTVIAVQEYNTISDRLSGYEWQMKQVVEDLIGKNSIQSKYAEYTKWKSDFDYYIDNSASIIVDTFVSGNSRKLAGLFNIMTKQTVSYADNIDLLLDDLEAYRSNNYNITMMCENETTAKALQNILYEHEITAVINENDEKFTPSVPNIIWGKNLLGFELTVTRFACMSLYANPNSLYRTVTTRRKSAKKKSSQEKIMSYADLEIGDYIVHQNHGIGKYLGLQTLTTDGIIKDYVKIQYSGTDMLYLPCNQLDSVAKYIGAKSEDGTVKLSRMGGADWGKAKLRAKAAAKDMAKDLIKLYAERLKREGFKFDKDDDLQREFESAFEYEETDAQLNAVAEIKYDMELSTPMDRLLCGDVGFGKTEVALRAAFKAVNNSKQTAILVPTTILAMQHYQTLQSRMRGFPVKVDMISRFRTPKQQQETLRRLRRGEIDIIVGTHRLISNDVIFKDLGLIVVDEEQRFGVAHKEKLKQMTNSVIDVLTLTATPIPRTLNMAMSGIRDMSVLEEAPGDRLPVQTYVLEYDDLIIAEALRKELRRGGQVFYLYNRVEDIDRVAAKINSMVPDARIATAHGQMDKELLSDIWRSMVIGDLDILISTTIIETGVDVPNANTLIIENADRMGLSQLHQIRGRVGRSSRRAYAYFTYPRGKVISEIAAKRLTAIRDYTEFGSGFKVALRDLEIRGAGNLLGAEQHGHIESIGYDLYMKILNEAILEERGEPVEVKSECTVEVKIEAYLPEKYINMSTQRIDMYKKIASIETEEDSRDITDELLDRYGDLPKSVINLLKISLIRSMGSYCNIAKIEQNNNTILIYPNKIDVSIWTKLAGDPLYKGKILLNLSSKPYINFRLLKDDNILESLIPLFKKYINIKKEMQ